MAPLGGCGQAGPGRRAGRNGSTSSAVPLVTRAPGVRASAPVTTASRHAARRTGRTAWGRNAVQILAPAGATAAISWWMAASGTDAPGRPGWNWNPVKYTPGESRRGCVWTAAAVT